MRRKIVTVMLATAVLAILLFALPLAILIAKYLIDDERAELIHAADLTALSATAEWRAATRRSLYPPPSPTSPSASTTPTAHGSSEQAHRLPTRTPGPP